MMLPIVQVDAFTDQPFRGNPAAVCVLPEPREDEWMQAVAREMNLSETAFLMREDNDYRLRWFTPTVEVDLCGHATLAAAHVLWEDGHLPTDEEARFRTRSGRLDARRDGEWIVLDFPAQPEEEIEPPEELLDALGMAPLYVGRSRFDLLVELESEDAVRSFEPAIARLAQVDTRGVIITARADSNVGDATAAEYDFVSRFFGPRVGVDEDPVTGSAHCVLGPFWQKRLGRAEMVGYQASERGGYVRVSVHGDRVRLGGQAVTVLRGSLVGGV